MERLIKIGNVKAFSSSEIKESRIGNGFEKLDRGVFDPEKAYDKVAATGAKWVRIQSGWARTEKSKGIYSFEWLDSIVDNLVKRGMRPWLCLCYGNPLYNAEAAKVFGAVGCPPLFSKEEKDAWCAYVTATVRRYTGKIQWYDVWNEPDGIWCWKHGPSGTEYGELVKMTAAAIKRGDPDAKVIGGSECSFNLEWLAAVLATGAGAVMDGYTYHNYVPNESSLPELVRGKIALLRRANPNIKIIQGETGCQSRSDGHGAMRGCAWTPLKQAKFMVRHTINDFISDVMFSSYFSCMDMVEALNGTGGDAATYKDFGYFGILSAEFDENGVASGIYTPKPSYRTMQTLASIFREEFTVEPMPFHFSYRYSRRMSRQEESGEHFSSVSFTKPNGSAAIAYWKPTEILTTSYEGTTTIESVIPGKPRLVDLLDGSVYEIPDSIRKYELPKQCRKDGEIVPVPPQNLKESVNDYTLFENIPVKDYPLLLTFGDFFDME